MTQVARKAPRAVGANESVKVKIVIEDVLPLELFGDCPALGRFALRSRGTTVAVGMITQIAPMAAPSG